MNIGMRKVLKTSYLSFRYYFVFFFYNVESIIIKGTYLHPHKMQYLYVADVSLIQFECKLDSIRTVGKFLH